MSCGTTRNNQKHPMELIAETFIAVNNGQIPEVSLPRSIDVLIPNFGSNSPNSKFR